MNTDWSVLDATQESLREHMAVIKQDEALMRQALDTLGMVVGDSLLGAQKRLAAIDALKARLGME